MLQYPQNITLCGFGGQGIILTAVLLGTAAVTRVGCMQCRPSLTVRRPGAVSAKRN